MMSIQSVTAEFAADLGCGQRNGEPTLPPLFVTSNQRIPVKTIFDRHAVVFCACEKIRLFSAVFLMQRLAINGTLYKFQHSVPKTMSHIDRHSFFYRLHLFSIRQSSKVLRDCEGRLLSLE